MARYINHSFGNGADRFYWHRFFLLLVALLLGTHGFSPFSFTGSFVVSVLFLGLEDFEEFFSTAFLFCSTDGVYSVAWFITPRSGSWFLVLFRSSGLLVFASASLAEGSLSIVSLLSWLVSWWFVFRFALWIVVWCCFRRV